MATIKPTYLGKAEHPTEPPDRGSWLLVTQVRDYGLTAARSTSQLVGRNITLGHGSHPIAIRARSRRVEIGHDRKSGCLVVKQRLYDAALNRQLTLQHLAIFIALQGGSGANLGKIRIDTTRMSAEEAADYIVDRVIG